MSFDAVIDRHAKAILIIAIVALTALAWMNRFVQDDAFISYRYAQNLAEGKGLVWNEGERVEGYTNFLWTVVLAIPFLLNIDPVPFSMGLGLAVFPISLWLTFMLARSVLASNGLALLSVVLLGTNFTFSAYASGGLETQWQACLFLAAAFLVVDGLKRREWGVGRLLGLSLILAAAFLTRMDSAILIVVLMPAVILEIIRQSERKALGVACLCLPAAAIAGAWLLWKLWYYGDILPNTYYAKGGLEGSWRYGLYFTYSFIKSYWLAPIVILPTIMFKRTFLKAGKNIWLLLGAQFLWTLYVIKVGGDFMEFRFWVPILPLFMICAVWSFRQMSSRLIVRAILAGLVFAGSIHHALTFETNETTQTKSQLVEVLYSPYQNWAGIGAELHRLFYSESNEVILASGAAGAMPFYSKLKSVDSFGLSDKWVARHGAYLGRPGHPRTATLEYFLKRGVNLVISRAIIKARLPEGPECWKKSDFEMFAIGDFKPELMPSGAKIIEIPLANESKVCILYLVQNDYVDQVIGDHGLITYSAVY